MASPNLFLIKNVKTGSGLSLNAPIEVPNPLTPGLAVQMFEHRDEIGSDLVAASRQGCVGEGSVARRARKTQELKRVPAGVVSGDQGRGAAG